MNSVQSLIQPQVLAQIGFAGVVALTLTGALIAVFPRNILYNVLGLIVCLTGVAGIFVYLGSPFIALMELLIYVGAICISIIFAIMLSRPLHLSLPKRRLPKVGLALGVGTAVFIMLSAIISRTEWQPAAMRSSDWSVTTLGTYLLTRYDLVFEADFSGAVGCHHWCHHHLGLCSQEYVVNSLYTYLFLAALLFSLGIFGVFQRRSLIGMLIAIELMLTGASINFMAFNRFLAPDPIVGQIYTLFIMGIAAAEAAIALSIIVAVFRRLRSINIERAQELRG